MNPNRRASPWCPVAGLRTLICLSLLACLQSARASDFAAAVIEGAGEYEPAELVQSYRSLLGQPLDEELLGRLVAAIEDRYVRDGRPRPTILTDLAWSDRGIVRLTINQQRRIELRVRGDAGPYARQVRAILDDYPATLNDTRQVRDILRRLRYLPGLEATIRNTTRSADGAQRVEVGLEFKRVEGFVEVSNRGVRSIGRVIGLADVQFNGLFGDSQSLELFGIASSHFDRYHAAGAELARTSPTSGLTLSLFGLASSAEVSPGTPDRRRRLDKSKLRVGVDQPIVADGNQRTSVFAQLQERDARERRGGMLVRDDDLLSLTAGIRSLWRNEAGRLSRVRVDMTKGISGEGRLFDEDGEFPDTRDFRFTIIQVEAATQVEFNRDWSALALLGAQYSNDRLPGTEQFRYGGNRYGRGFEPGELAGDSGVAGRLNVARKVYGFSDYADELDAYGFIDTALVWRDDGADRASGTSAGFGLQAAVGNWDAYVELATPLGARRSRQDDLQMFGELRYAF